MSRKNKSYLAELKYQAVGDYLSGEGSLREICKNMESEINIRYKTG